MMQEQVATIFEELNDKTKLLNQLVGLLDLTDPSGNWCQGWVRTTLKKHCIWVPDEPK